jgi:protein-S-isoprenylcysteine O-methyltransferase Ste14
VSFNAVVEQTSERPASAVVQWINWVGVFCFGAILALGLQQGLPLPLLFVLLMAGYAGPIALFELYRRRGNLLPELTDGWAGRTVTRTLAHYFIFAIMMVLVWAMPWYKVNFLDSIFAAVDGRFVIAFSMLIIFLTPFYLMLVDHDPSKPGESLDGGLALGEWLSGQRHDPRQRNAILQFVLGWTVKFFFIPYMLGLAWESLEGFSNWDWPVAGFATLTAAEARDFVRETAIYFMGFLDTTIALIGYCLTMRLFNSHIRSTDCSGFGWLVCIICYGPWWLMFYQSYVDYDDDSYWQDWLSTAPDLLTWIWGGLILLFTAIYLWATIAFGIRFSNLTNRGIITNGPYRFVKHPAYLSKCIFFWLLSVPFVPVAGAAEAIRLCVLLGLVNLVYFFRAKTEERHLRQDPDYVSYQSWIAENGLWGRLRKLVRR